MIKTFYELNDYLRNLLLEGKPASVIRLDNTTGYIIDCALKNVPISNEFFNPTTILEGGIYPNTVEYAFSYVYKNTFECMLRAECVGFVDISGEIKNNSPMKEIFKDKVMFFKDGYMVFDPGSLLGYSKFYIENLDTPDNFVPWTTALKGKKVLVISTHVESIKYQWKNRKQIWGDNYHKMSDFELVDVIRAPYHPSLDDRQYPNTHSWGDMVNYIKNLIEEYDYDVLLSGSSTSSPIFVDYAKVMGKVGIQTGGVIQLLFGIKGGRWAKVSAYSDWNRMFNEHWIYPLKIDQPQNKIQGLESNFAYWG